MRTEARPGLRAAALRGQNCFCSTLPLPPLHAVSSFPLIAVGGAPREQGAITWVKKGQTAGALRRAANPNPWDWTYCCIGPFVDLKTFNHKQVKHTNRRSDVNYNRANMSAGHCSDISALRGQAKAQETPANNLWHLCALPRNPSSSKTLLSCHAPKTGTTAQ